MAKVLIKKWGAHINALRAKGLPIELIEILEGLEEQDRLVNNRVEEVSKTTILEGVPFGPGQLIGLQAPKSADFAWDNQGTSTVVYTPKSAVMTIVPNAVTFRFLRQVVPSLPFTITTWMRALMYESSTQTVGMVLYYNAAGNIRIIDQHLQNPTSSFLSVVHAVSATVGPIVTDYAGANSQVCLMSGGIFFRIQAEAVGGSVRYSYSLDGENFVELHNNLLGADVPTHWGWGGYRDMAGAIPQNIWLFGYKVTQP